MSTSVPPDMIDDFDTIVGVVSVSDVDQTMRRWANRHGPPSGDYAGKIATRKELHATRPE